MERGRSLVEAHAAVLLFGLAGLFGKWILLSPLLIVFGRVVFSALTLGAVSGLTGASLRVERRNDALLLLGLGILLAAHWTAFFHSIQISTVAVGLLSYSTFPVFTSFLEPVLLGERLEVRPLLLSLLCLAGVFLLIPRFDISNNVFLGVLWGLLAGLSFAVLSILNRKLARTYPSLLVAFVQDLSASFVLLPAALLGFSGWTLRNMALLAVLGIVCTAGAHTLFIESLKGLSARTASIISSLEPVYGVGLAFLFLGERPSCRTLAGGSLILAAAFLASFRKRKGRPSKILSPPI